MYVLCCNMYVMCVNELLFLATAAIAVGWLLVNIISGKCVAINLVSNEKAVAHQSNFVFFFAF